MRGLEQVLKDRERIGTAIVKFAQISQRVCDLPTQCLLEEIKHAAAISQAQHGAHRSGVDGPVFVMGDGLIEQRQAVAHRTFGGACDERQRRRFDVDLFFVGDV